ncbi:MOSC domain-containing protein [Desulfogranum japonicum]|uniref:MOSC domain-containing protein n=1 Tax=Desulfogranum japonicum TaxID=231447 RepID=UPI000415FD2B|nr:MOSC domain-containing protein [Desulfogranum japonicum]
MATIVSLNVSEAKGTQKQPVKSIELKVDHGITGDAHAGKWHRQVSLLAEESIDFMRSQGLSLDPGAFAENITTRGLELHTLPVGTLLGSGEVVLEVTQIGKKCHQGCEIFKQVGDCIMPREGIFTKVIKPGTLHQRDTIEVISSGQEDS